MRQLAALYHHQSGIQPLPCHLAIMSCIFSGKAELNFVGKFKLPEPENVSNNRETLQGTETGSSEVLKSLKQHRFCRI